MIRLKIPETNLQKLFDIICLSKRDRPFAILYIYPVLNVQVGNFVVITFNTYHSLYVRICFTVTNQIFHHFKKSSRWSIHKRCASILCYQKIQQIRLCLLHIFRLSVTVSLKSTFTCGKVIKYWTRSLWPSTAAKMIAVFPSYQESFSLILIYFNRIQTHPHISHRIYIHLFIFY